MPFGSSRDKAAKSSRTSRRPAELRIDGLDRPIALRISRQARRIILKIRPDDGRVEVTIPPWTSRRAAGDFAAKNLEWIEERLELLPKPVPFAAGAAIPLQGVEHRIVPSGTLRGRVRREDGTLIVPGEPEHLARRVTDWLKAEARRVICDRVRTKAARAGLKFSNIAVRDTTTRWGSCTCDGCLSFSWRLFLAPDYVLDYVVAHEVAHLRHLDHGARFWKLTATLTDGDVELAKTWLNGHGHDLLRYGQSGA
jgi:predicted metal-dependent hydrolase